MEKSQFDRRQYQPLRLQNGLTALLVRDPDATHSSVAVGIRVGFRQDPPAFQGLAHLLEHAIFMGSKHFPSEKALYQFVGNYDGWVNALTKFGDTVFLGQVQVNGTAKLVEMYADAVQRPLLRTSSIVREVTAVENEHIKNRTDDMWIHYQLLKHTSNQQHPFNRFATGTSKSLLHKGNDELARAIRILHRTHYTAHATHVVLISPLSLKEMEVVVSRNFRTMATSKRALTNPPRSVLGSSVQRMYRTKTVDALPKLYFTWELPYQPSADRILHYLFTNEHPKSLHSALRQKSLITNAVAGSIESNQTFFIFILTFHLSTQGQQRVPEVVDHVFAYTNFLRNAKASDLVATKQNLVDSAFNNLFFRQDTETANDALTLYDNFRMYPSRHHIIGNKIINTNTFEAFRQVTVHLGRFRVDHFAHQLQGTINGREPWYGTVYQVVNIKARPVSTKFLLPSRNALIPTKLQLLPVQDFTPQLPTTVYQQPGIRMWCNPTRFSNMPIANMCLSVQSASVPDTPVSLAHLVVLAAAIRYQFATELFNANTAGVDFQFTPVAANAFHVQLRGFPSTMALFVTQILNASLSSVSHFPIAMQRARQYVNEQRMGYLLHQAVSTQRYCTQTRSWTGQEIMYELSNVTEKSLLIFAVSFSQRMMVQGLFHGNIRISTIQTMAKVMHTRLRPSAFSPADFTDPEVVQFKHGVDYYAHVPPAGENERGSAVLVSHQIGTYTPRTHALLRLLNDVIQPMLFQYLRTEKQLGYLVTTGIANHQDILSYWVAVQSGKYAPRVLEREIRFALHSIANSLGMLRIEVQQNEIQRPASQVIYDEWIQVTRRTLDFKQHTREMRELDSISTGDLARLMAQFIAGPAKRLVVSVDSSKPLLQDLQPYSATAGSFVLPCHDCVPHHSQNGFFCHQLVGTPLPRPPRGPVIHFTSTAKSTTKPSLNNQFSVSTQSPFVSKQKVMIKSPNFYEFRKTMPKYPQSTPHHKWKSS